MITVLRLCCPACGRRLAPLEALSVATVNVRRKCPRCATRWSITVSAIPTHNPNRVHKAVFTAYEGSR